MSGSVRVEIDGGIAIVAIDHQPVNALSTAVRMGLLEAFRSISKNEAVRGAVLVGAGRIFISGADIREFDKPLRPPGLGDVIDEIEACAKPVVAAIHGVALGGGLEVALGCHFRVAAKDAKLGLPEVRLGLMPGAGGTQRLPRIVGPALAVKMIVSGEPISAVRALQHGLIDEIFEGDPIAAGKDFLQDVITNQRSLRRLSRDDSMVTPAAAARAILTNAAAEVIKRARGLEAPLAAVEAVGWSIDMPFELAMKKEGEAFLRLMEGDQSKAQRHAFFAEREASKIAGLPADTKPRDVNKIAIIGAGTMGGGIAMAFANAGIPVVLIEVSEANLERGLSIIRGNYQMSVSRGGLTTGEMEGRLKLIGGAVGIENVASADLIIEAAFETMAVKLDIFGQLDRFAKADAILATNTSYLDVNAIALATKRPQNVLGMHFFSPANVMRLCEIVRGKKTAPEALATAMSVARRIGKVPVVVGVCFGFVGNRMLEVRGKQANKLLYSGATPQQVDAALTRFGMPMGHFAMVDLAGLDIGWRSRKDRGESSPIEDKLCEEGRLGQKAGKGFFSYEGGSRAPSHDQHVDDLIEHTIAELGLKPRSIGEDEIFERLIYPMINEGTRILEEAIASRAGDIDIVWLYGYGWPIKTGGPMFYAGKIGLDRIADRLRHYANEDDDRSLEPTSLLRDFAKRGATFSTSM
jgi:3-hydroxyacyl-CoA dehydrogenase